MRVRAIGRWALTLGSAMALGVVLARPTAPDQPQTTAPAQAPAPAPTAEPAGPPGPSPHIKFDATELDLGDVIRGQDAVATFTYHNTGPVPLHILSAKPG
jgi:hypothetical protein